VVTKIVELAKAGRKGDDLIEQTLLAFQGNEAERRRAWGHDSARELVRCSPVWLAISNRAPP
jgi:hypothetical protein